MLKRLVPIIMILMLCLNVAFVASAETWDDPWTSWDEAFWFDEPIELGDESMPVYVMGGAALMLAAGCVIAHRRRRAQ